MELCKLCNNNTKLVKSHIISEFCYKPLYDNLHRFPGCSDAQNGKIEIYQKGVKEKMLCKNCEDILSKYESYVRDLFYGNNGIINNKFYNIEVNYPKFKLFALSILWRASVAKDKSFKHVILGRNHEGKLRNMILLGDPGKYYEYGFLLSFNIDDEGKVIDDLIKNPDCKRIRDGHRIYRFLFSGIWLMFIVSNHSKNLSEKISSLNEDGKLTIYDKKLSEHPLYNTYAQKLTQQKQKLLKLEKFYKRS